MYSPFDSLILIGIYSCEQCQRRKRDVHYDFIGWGREKYKMAIDRELLK